MTAKAILLVTNLKASISYPDFAKDVKKGDKVLVDDGKLIFEVLSTDKKSIVKLKNIQGGIISSRKRINLPNTKFPHPHSQKRIKKIYSSRFQKKSIGLHCRL